MNKRKTIINKLESAIKLSDRWLEYQRVSRRIPGLVVGIVYEDKIIFNKSYGYSDFEKRVKLNKNDYFRVASISKMFTAMAIMSLVEKNKIQLKDKVSKHLPWFTDKNKSLDKITIKELLNHSSGLDRDGNTSHWMDDNFPDLVKLKSHVQKGAVIYPPLKKFKYSNLGYAILGQLISEVSGISYEEYVDNNIIKKLGLKNTFPDINSGIIKNLSKGYGRDIPGIKRENFGNPQTNSLASATGFVSNSFDLCKFISSQFISDSCLSLKSKKEMQKIQWTENKGDNKITYGFGTEIWNVDKNVLCGHGGGFSGYITRLAFDPKRKIGVVVLTNCLDGKAFDLANGVFQIIYNMLYRYDNYKSLKNEKINLEKYEGKFSDRWGDVNIVKLNNSLVLFYPSSNLPIYGIMKLKHLTDNTFLIETGDNFDYIGEKVIFNFNKYGKITELKVGPNTLVPRISF